MTRRKMDDATIKLLKSIDSGLAAIRDYCEGERSHTQYCNGDSEGAPCDCPNINPRDVIDALREQIIDARLETPLKGAYLVPVSDREDNDEDGALW